VITEDQDEDETQNYPLSDLDHETNPSQPSSSSDLGSSISLPSSSSSSSSLTNLFEPLEASVESKEEKRRRRNNEACAKNRKKKKMMEEEETSELERLEERNRNLKTTVQHLEESLAWQKSLMIPLLAVTSRKRKVYEGDSEERGKKKRQ
jgi:predicted RNase H-like nuclease (RuvC/YqgF family)